MNKSHFPEVNFKIPAVTSIPESVTSRIECPNQLIDILLKQMADDTDSECSSVANLSDFNNFEDLQMPEFVDIAEVRHIEYVGPYMH